MRLIDADALIEQMEEDMEHMEEPLAKMFTGAAISDIKHAPTVEAPDINVGNIDTISRQQAINKIHEDADWLAAQGSDWQTERMERDKSILMSLPSVQPERKTGKWIERESGTEDKENGFETVIVCSCCDFPATTFYSEDCESRTQIRTDFCPNCGAKMEKR